MSNSVLTNRMKKSPNQNFTERPTRSPDKSKSYAIANSTQFPLHTQ